MLDIMKKIITLRWKAEHWKHLHPQDSEEGLQEVTNPPLPPPSHPAVQQPTLTESLEDVLCPVDERMCEKQEYVQLVPNQEHRYGAQHGGQYRGHCKPGPIVFIDVRYGAPTIEDRTVDTILLKAEYCPRQNSSVSQTAKMIKEVKVAKEPYVKKPPNAFMLFLKENRKSVEEELGERMSTVVNKVLGERWKTLSLEEKNRYNAEAVEHALLHTIQNPGWTNRINYRNKKKRSQAKVVCAEETK
ncbi:transcription factor 7-like 1 isoform X2 [Gouania willdenowi]|uniref:transcription factor 7-like 1 isoform X2 n=1 Tax=Gouania willdenowi TaxID=441366 RepID=UPI0010560C2D|nr:transcription factor 7-like 1 isoform X2 [Gouania willdenowi]